MFSESKIPISSPHQTPSPNRVNEYESMLSFANLSQKAIINQGSKSPRKNLFYFNGCGYNLNFDSPKTLNACLELGITKEMVQEQIINFNKLNNETISKELPEIHTMKKKHFLRRITGFFQIFIEITSSFRNFEEYFEKEKRNHPKIFTFEIFNPKRWV